MKERYEQEIEQLLSELEAESPQPAGVPPPDDPVRPVDDEPSPFTPRPKVGMSLISPGKLALAGIILAVVGLVMPLLKWLSLVGLAILAASVVWMFVRRMGRQQPAYWRGRPIEEPPQGTWQRFRRWLAK